MNPIEQSAMQSQAEDPQRSFAKLFPTAGDAERVAERGVAIWREIDLTLSPIIGLRGIDALFGRSFALTVEKYPWLAGAHDQGFRPGAAPSFRTLLARQDRSAASGASAELLQTFDHLLSNLIGAALCERLLAPVWDNLGSTGSGRDQ